MKEKILNEIEHELKKVYDILDLTENKDKETHLMALGQQLALANLKYSVINNDWLYKKGVKENGK